jgi:hypothetical protein
LIAPLLGYALVEQYVNSQLTVLRNRRQQSVDLTKRKAGMCTFGLIGPHENWIGPGYRSY